MAKDVVDKLESEKKLLIVKLEAKLFCKEEPKPEIHLGRVAPTVFLALEICPHKLSFVTYDGKEDLLPWLNRASSSSRVNRP